MKNTSQGQVPPPILYQYRPPTERALGNLCKQVLHFSSPADFNDPFEWCLPPRYPEDMTSEQVMAQVGPSREKFARTVSREENIRRLNSAFEQNFGNWRREGGGVVCFSECKRNMLMWAHYADRHRGFCLAFDSGLKIDGDSDGQRIRRMQVRYSNELPETNILKIDQSVRQSGNDGLFMELLRRKAKYWEYEKEWRLMRKDIRDTGRVSHYQPEALKAVYLGAVAEDSTRDDISDTVEKRYPDTQLWQARLNENGYGVRFCPVNEVARAAHEERE